MWLGDLLVLIPLLLIAIAIGLAFALRIACRRRTGERLVAGDPYFFPIGEWPSIDEVARREAIPNYRRRLDPDDFRTWRVPTSTFAGALLRTEGDGRLSASLSSEQSAVVLPFRGRRV